MYNAITYELGHICRFWGRMSIYMGRAMAIQEWGKGRERDM